MLMLLYNVSISKPPTVYPSYQSGTGLKDLSGNRPIPKGGVFQSGIGIWNERMPDGSAFLQTVLYLLQSRSIFIRLEQPYPSCTLLRRSQGKNKVIQSRIFDHVRGCSRTRAICCLVMVNSYCTTKSIIKSASNKLHECRHIFIAHYFTSQVHPAQKQL
jgi:hypothetical protein